MRRRSLLKTMAVLPMAPPNLSGAETRAWLGPDYWANPLQDWRKSGDRFECHVAGGDRNVFWLSKEIGQNASNFKMTVRLGKLTPAGAGTRQGWVGFRIGMRGHFNDYRDTAIRGLGLEAGITGDGRLFIGAAADGPRIASLDGLTLTLERSGQTLRLSAGGQSLELNMGADQAAGGVALVCHSGELPTGAPDRAEPQ
ncbi:MAG TPA: hypothetical protein VEX68_17035, partial [Bryobacteraceae bacterium]|nr:hypothetical protein [Bryobacteraceae bacterium]